MIIDLIGCPMDLGQTRRGVDMGPSALRAARIERRLEDLGFDLHDMGDIGTPEVETRRLRDPKLRYLPEIVQICEELARRVESCAKRKHFPLVLGGDHSITMGTMAGLVRSRGPQALIYFDAHGDFNTPDTTPSGSIHGMSLAACVGLGHPKLVKLGRVTPKVRAENVALIGVRNLDPGEKDLVKKSGMRVYTMRDVDEAGIKNVIQDALDKVLPGTKGLHLSFDVDVLDPREAPGTGTPWPGGLTFRESHSALEFLAERNVITSFELVEVNPLLDNGNRTAELAVGLVESALGKQIL
ncbi:MAG: arginase [Methanobacteriota archaeon]